MQICALPKTNCPKMRERFPWDVDVSMVRYSRTNTARVSALICGNRIRPKISLANRGKSLSGPGHTNATFPFNKVQHCWIQHLACVQTSPISLHTFCHHVQWLNVVERNLTVVKLLIQRHLTFFALSGSANGNVEFVSPVRATVLNTCTRRKH